MMHLGDITKLNGAEIPVVDVITGGSPCQDLSVAGKRAGLAGARSGLFMEQIRIVKEMREQDVRSGRNPAHARPRYMVWENVPGAFSSGNPKGADFAAVLEEIIKVTEPGADVCVRLPDGGWTKSGCYYAEDGTWSIAWRVHDAQFWGVPQRRKRISLVADFGGLSAPEILFERKGLSGDSEPCGAQREETAGTVGGGVEGASGTISFQERGGKPGGGKGILIQHEHVGALSTLNNQSALSAGLANRGYYTGDVTETLRSDPHGAYPLVSTANAQGVDVYNQTITGEVAASVTAAVGGTNTSGPKVFCLQGNGIDRADTAGCNGRGWCEDVSYTLNTIDRPAVMAFAQNQVGEVRVSSMSGTLNTNSNATGRNSPLVYDARGNGNGVLPFDTTQITSPQNGCNPHYGDPCHPLAAGAHPPAVAIRGEQQPVVAFTQNQRNEVRDLGDVAGALAAEPGVHQQTYVYENHSQDSRFRPLGDICQTVSATYGMGGNNQPLVVSDAVCVGNGQLSQMSMAEQANTLDTMHDQQAVTLDLNGGSPACNQGGIAVVQPSYCDVSPTLNTAQGGQRQPCVVDTYQETVGALCACISKQVGNQIVGQDQIVTSNAIVRRLTPLECERLQGYPDGWTDIGEWVDSKGKKHKASDSPRYKALGNSIALPFWFWLLRRISAQYERPATLGSLFDGIGGFPLCWERCNGKGTALWASEIEEFPIAVTKIRFSETERRQQ